MAASSGAERLEAAVREPLETSMTPQPASQVTSRTQQISAAPTLDGPKGDYAVVVEDLTKRSASPLVACRVVASMFDRERLVIGRRG